MSFLQIEKCYIDQPSRELNRLKSIYDNTDLLRNHVRSVIGNRLPDADVAGKKVLLKPNWVREELKDFEEYCLRTNDNLLLVVLEEILLRKPKEVMIGDAPIQGCYWEKMVHKVMPEITACAAKYNIPVKTKDFRRIVFHPSTNSFHDRTNDMEKGILFDLGSESFLEEICNDRRKPFRITQYPPSFLAEHHHSGVHRYCITPEFFEYDLIITLPKIKTHEKAGLTNALKILVGINADKNYLPHHRVGGTGLGGDCYQGSSILRRTAEYFLDMANRNIGSSLYKPLGRVAQIIWRLSSPTAEHTTSAGWYGNDTTWRMVMDLNTIAKYGQADGTINWNNPRKIYSLCDGIIAGQGNGPLNPSPAPLGILMFTNNNALADISAAILMGINYNKVPLLRALNLTDQELSNICISGTLASLDDLQRESIHVDMPGGWANYNR